MTISRDRVRRMARYFDVDPLAVRVYAALLVLLPILTIALAGLFDSIVAGFVVAGTVSVTVIAILPHDRGRLGAYARR